MYNFFIPALYFKQKMANSEEIVKELEETFKDRYTEKDESYKAVLEETEQSPPILSNFGSSDNQKRHSHSESDSKKRSRSRSRSRSPVATLKRKGMFDCYSYFVYYY